MERPIIHPKYVAEVLDTMRKLDPGVTEKLLLLKIPTNDVLKKHATIHFYDNQLTIFGALAGMTSEEAPCDTEKAPVSPIIDFFNSILYTDELAIRKLIDCRFPVNSELAKCEDFTFVVDGNLKNPRLGLLGILNALVGVKDGWGQIGVKMGKSGNVFEFFYMPEFLANKISNGTK